MPRPDRIRVGVNGYGVIPETIDAIRALTGIVEDANESIARTNAALGIEPSLV